MCCALFLCCARWHRGPYERHDGEESGDAEERRGASDV